MNLVQHIQYPVGQGGLHLGIIGDIAYIYDCGSAYQYRCVSYIHHILDELNTYNIKKIYIFISHLHSDHVCALLELLRQLQKQHISTKIYLPYITPLEKLYLIMSSADNNNLYDWYVNFVINPQSITEVLSESDVMLTYVSDKTIEKTQDNDIDRTNIEDCYKLKNILCQQISIYDFVFDPFVYQNFAQSNKTTFQAEIKKLVMNWPLTNTDLQNIIKTNLKDLCDAYKSLHKNINYTCLCLYCGPESIRISSDLFVKQCCFGCLQYFPNAGWLHTGDYNVKCGKGSKYGKNFVEHYEKYFDYVGVIQIPHHGSANNISKPFIDKFRNDDCIWFLTGELCPFGRQQPQRSYVLQQITQPVFLVSELPCSEIVQHTHIKDNT